MLDTLRAFAKTWIAKILLAILVVSFGAFGISNVITNLGTNVIARVGDEEITTIDFQRSYQSALANAAQQIGKQPTSQEAMAMGIPSQVIARLSADAAVNRFASQMGLGASDQQLAKMLRADPSFTGLLGQFDRNSFNAVLQQNGYTEAQYFDMQTKAARRNQLAVGMFGDAAVPETAQQLINRYASDTRTLNYFVINSLAVPAVAAPTDAELADYLKQHQAEYRTPETRKVDVLSMSLDSLAATKTFTDAEIAAQYERTKASLTKIEKRDIKQVVLPNDAAVKTFTDGQTAGKSFDELAKAANLPVTDLGTLTQAEVTDPALAKAAFGLAQGAFTIIDGVVGKRAISVPTIEAGGTLSLADAKESIVKNLAMAAAKKEYSDDLDQIEELRASFQPLATIAKRYNLSVSGLDMKNDGAALSAVADIAATDRPKVTAAIFAAQADKLVPTVTLSSNHNVWFDLKSVQPARDQTLAEVHDALVTAWTNEKTTAEIAKAAVNAVADIKAGKSFNDVASTLNQFPQLSQPIKRTGDGSQVLNQDVANAAFAGGPNYYGSSKNGDGDYVVFQVESITPAAGTAPAQARSYMDNAIRDSLFGEFITGVRNEAGLRVNDAALNQVLALSSTGN
ncbi:MAG: PpiD [Hyphomicrobiales bacterium]|nr:PpiD [Hyphomicrobiales bacterium]